MEGGKAMKPCWVFFITFKMFIDVSNVRIFPRKTVELENVLNNTTETEAMFVLAKTVAHQEQIWGGKAVMLRTKFPNQVHLGHFTLDFIIIWSCRLNACEQLENVSHALEAKLPANFHLE